MIHSSSGFLTSSLHRFLTSSLQIIIIISAPFSIHNQNMLHDYLVLALARAPAPPTYSYYGSIASCPGSSTPPGMTPSTEPLSPSGGSCCSSIVYTWTILLDGLPLRKQLMQPKPPVTCYRSSNIMFVSIISNDSYSMVLSSICSGSKWSTISNRSKNIRCILSRKLCLVPFWASSACKISCSLRIVLFLNP